VKRNFDKENRKFDKSFEDVPHISFDDDIFWDEACKYYKQDIEKW
jgi:hypothetical protein